MADINLYIPILKAQEGGYVNNPNDKGGPTNMGITLAEFQSYYGADKTVDDLKAITDEQWLPIVKKEYWDCMQADLITDQQVAVAIVDFGFNSGQGTAVMKVQAILGISPTTGFLGNITLNKINIAEASVLCNAICDSRDAYDTNYAEKVPAEAQFLPDWLRRTNSLRYKATT